MNKTIILIICGIASVCGCQTRITAEKFPEQALPIQRIVQVNGRDEVITERYQIASGGWYTTARSPLYATEVLEGLSLGIQTNGLVELELGHYGRDLSTNSVTTVREMFSGGAQLVTAIGDAYLRITGGGVTAETVLANANRIYSLFTSSGGNPSAASVTVNDADGSISVCDGTTCVNCNAAGLCTVCTDCEAK